MIRLSELEAQKRAQALFEKENPGKAWRLTSGNLNFALQPKKVAGLIERQNYLSRVRAEMLNEGLRLEVEE